MNNKFDLNAVKRLMKYIIFYRIKFIMVILFIIISSIVSAVSSLFLQVLIDNYINPLLLESTSNFSGLLKTIITMIFIYLIGVISTFFYNRLMSSISQNVLKRIRDDMFFHMQKLPIKYFDTHSHGNIMSYYTNDIDTLRQMISQSLPQIFASIITIISIFFSMLFISIWLTSCVVISIFFIIKFASKILNKSGGYFVKQQESLGDVNGYIEEMINGQKVVKVFCYEKRAVDKFKEKNNKLCENAISANKYANILMPCMMNLGYFLYVLIAILGGLMAITNVPNFCLVGQNVLTLGMIASFLQLSVNFITPISQVSQQFNSIITALAGAKRIFALLDEKQEIDNGKITLIKAEENRDCLIETNKRIKHWMWKVPQTDDTFNYKKLEGKIEFNNVNFGYASSKVILHDINLTVEPGQKIALVGGTGAGKTTIANLINRFYDINNGKIYYDGIDIKNIKKQDLRKSLGIVLQDVNLFTGTIMENIRYGRLDATDKECIDAAKLVNADNFIQMLPKGYQTVISGNNSSLSQGQRQLISIARAAVADPPVMILDEATFSIDTRTESIIQRGMDALMQGRTVFVIAHRLSTIKNSDTIIVLERGRIIEKGTHDELLSQKNEYYRMYTGAFELN